MQAWQKWKNAPIVNLAKLTLALLATVLICYVAAMTAGILAPFVLALLCAMAMEPLIRLMSRIHIKKRYLPRQVASLISLLLMVGVLGVLVTVVVNVVMSQLAQLVAALPSWAVGFSQNLTKLMGQLEETIRIMPEETADAVIREMNSTLLRIASQLSGLVSPAAKGVWSTVRSVPYVILFVVMWLVGTFYMSIGRPRISAFFNRELPKQWMTYFRDIRNRLFRTLFRYLGAQVLLATFAFFIVLAGLTLLRVPYALLLALICALVDFIPALGTGFVLNPWALYHALNGEYPMAIALVAIYLAVMVGRNLLEPRLVSAQIGVPPLLTMTSMYAGFRLIGVAGLFAGPILMIVLRIAYDYYAHGRTLKQILSGESYPTPSVKPDA